MSDTGILIMVCGGMLALSIIISFIAVMLLQRAEKVFKGAETDLKEIKQLRDILLAEREVTKT